MNIASKVLEDAIATLNNLLTMDDPALLAGDVGEHDIGCGSPSQPHELSPEQACKLLRRHEHPLVSFWRSDPLAIVGERTTRHEHVDMGVPFESSRPGVQDCKSTNAPTELLWIATEDRQRFERRPEEHG